MPARYQSVTACNKAIRFADSSSCPGENILNLVKGYHQSAHQQSVARVERWLKRAIGALGSQRVTFPLTDGAKVDHEGPFLQEQPHVLRGAESSQVLVMDRGKDPHLGRQVVKQSIVELGELG